MNGIFNYRSTVRIIVADHNKNINVLSCPDAIAKALEEALGPNCEPKIVSSNNKCPECGYPMRRDSGCNICDRCGYDKCG